MALESLFRGTAPGVQVGPYLSQFLLIGNAGVNASDTAHALADGMIAYGAIRIDQRVRVASPGVDYMTDWPEFLDVQNGAARPPTPPTAPATPRWPGRA